MAVIQESSWTDFNIQDVDVSLNGFSLRGLMNEDVCIRCAYDEPRANFKESIDNNIVIVHTNSKLGSVTLTTSNVTKTWQTLIAYLNAHMSGELLIQGPKSKCTLRGATVVNPGEVAYGKMVSNTEVVLKGVLDILPIGEDIVEISTL